MVGQSDRQAVHDVSDERFVLEDGLFLEISRDRSAGELSCVEKGFHGVFLVARRVPCSPQEPGPRTSSSLRDPSSISRAKPAN